MATMYLSSFASLATKITGCCCGKRSHRPCSCVDDVRGRQTRSLTIGCRVPSLPQALIDTLNRPISEQELEERRRKEQETLDDLIASSSGHLLEHLQELQAKLSAASFNNNYNIVPGHLGSKDCVYIHHASLRHKMMIKHKHSEYHVCVKNGCLSLAKAQDEDDSFLFTQRLISGYRDCGNGDIVLLVEFSTHKNEACSGNTTCVTAERRDSAAEAKCMRPVSGTDGKLDRRDPRFFEPQFADHSHFTFQSLKHPGCYLAVDLDAKRLILEKTTDPSDGRFKFVIKEKPGHIA